MRLQVVSDFTRPVNVDFDTVVRAKRLFDGLSDLEQKIFMRSYAKSWTQEIEPYNYSREFMKIMYGPRGQEAYERLRRDIGEG